MKTVEISESALAGFRRRIPRDTCVLTRRGRPVAAVVPIRPGVDLETFGLSHNPEFIAIINRSWAGYKAKGGTSIEEIRRKHGLRPKAQRRRRVR